MTGKRRTPFCESGCRGGRDPRDHTEGCRDAAAAEVARRQIAARGLTTPEFSTPVPLIEPPTPLEPIDIVCERCATAFVHTPQRARIGEKIYTVPPVAPKMCRPCGDALRQAELDEDERVAVRDLEARAAAVVPALYRDTARIDTLGDARATYLREWLKGSGSMYLVGVAGAGKTHTAAAVAREAVLTGRHGRVVWWNVPELLERLQNSFGDPKRGAAIADEIEGADLLILDNAGQEKASEWVVQRLFVIVNRRYERGERVIVTSELNLDEIAAKLGRAIARRLAAMSEGSQISMPKIYGGES